ncbi:hypothetical protein H0G86_002095 [Trichoderma simmonsii]|uniref:Uncharacterized protein n=1 Tax=Trichoderma simmonsii TaxID=1491479 RepID=A0A8G0PB57_9HYPO|nr:hypothetical protein H0G86_002095 [Trichoderma simmonsii]
MGGLQDVTRFLLAAGGSPSTDGKSIHLFHEVKNSLFMETWTGSELTDRVEVVTGVRSDTSAPLVNLHYKRIFVVDQSHVLKCFTETSKAEDEGDDEDEEEEEDSRWEDEELDDLDIRVHDKSQLAVACGEFTIVVFYQNPDGTIGAIEDDGSHDGWKIAQLPNAEALPGTPMASFQAKDTVYFVYVATDRTFRYLEHSNNEWKDAAFSSAKIDGTTAKISLAEDEKAETDPKLLIFRLADNKLSTIKPGSTEAKTWGTVEDGVYKPTSDQENGDESQLPRRRIPNPFYTEVTENGDELPRRRIRNPFHTEVTVSVSGPPPQSPATVPVAVPVAVAVPFPVAPPACYEDFGQLSLSEHAVEYQQPPPYEYPYGRFDERYYNPHDETLLRQPGQRPDPSWQPPYQRPQRAGDLYYRDSYQRNPYHGDPYYQDGYPPDRYPQDYYQRDPYQRNPYERGPYQRDPNQPPPLEFSRSRQQDPLQGLSRQQQVPPQESSQQQQQQQRQQQLQPPTQEALRRQQGPVEEPQRRQQAPVEEPKKMMTTLLPGLSLKRNADVLLNLIWKRYNNHNNDNSSSNGKSGNNSSNSSSNKNVIPFRPLSSRKMTTWRKPPSNVVPRHKAGVLIKTFWTSLQNDDRPLAVELPWTPRLMKMKKYSSNTSGVIVEKQWSVIAKTNFFGVLIKKNLGVLAKKSIRVPVALLLNIVAFMSLTVPISVMDMKVIIRPIDTRLAPDLIL